MFFNRSVLIEAAGGCARDAGARVKNSRSGGNKKLLSVHKPLPTVVVGNSIIAPKEQKAFRIRVVHVICCTLQSCTVILFVQ